MISTVQIGGLKAVVFDIDGTLYRQGPLRRAMLLRLLGVHGAHPVRGWQTIRILRAYRRAQEALRAAPPTSNVAAAQITLTCERTNVDRRFVVECVRRWMEAEPLAFLPRCLQPGILEFLHDCKARGLRLGALSDYPADAKIHALGLADLFDVVLCAQARDIDVFKPNPRGLLVALERLGSSRAESLYIGDRVDVDAATAEAAGVPCVILTPHRAQNVRGAYTQVASYPQLFDLLWPAELSRVVR
jgi:putative hydrolase of the HAD superfamily